MPVQERGTGTTALTLTQQYDLDFIVTLWVEHSLEARHPGPAMWHTMQSAQSPSVQSTPTTPGERGEWGDDRERHERKRQRDRKIREIHDVRERERYRM